MSSDTHDHSDTPDKTTVRDGRQGPSRLHAALRACVTVTACVIVFAAVGALAPTMTEQPQMLLGAAYGAVTGVGMVVWSALSKVLRSRVTALAACSLLSGLAMTVVAASGGDAFSAVRLGCVDCRLESAAAGALLGAAAPWSIAVTVGPPVWVSRKVGALLRGAGTLLADRVATRHH
jgi:hypothetical protein